jgi:hypothetical protein
MPLFRPIDMTEEIRFLDARSPMPRNDKQAALDVFYAEFHRLLDEVSETAETEPGCHRMWRSKDSRLFLEQRNELGGFQHFSAFRANLKEGRSLSGLHGTSRTLLAWNGQTPIGGVVLYNDAITTVRGDGTIEFVSHIGPFLTPPSLNVEFMRWMLYNAVGADADDGTPLVVQLVEWRHDSQERGNLWRPNTPSAALWDVTDGIEADFETIDGQLVRTATRKMPT